MALGFLSRLSVREQLILSSFNAQGIALIPEFTLSNFLLKPEVNRGLQGLADKRLISGDGPWYLTRLGREFRKLHRLGDSMERQGTLQAAQFNPRARLELVIEGNRYAIDFEDESQLLPMVGQTITAQVFEYNQFYQGYRGFVLPRGYQLPATEATLEPALCNPPNS